MTLVLTLLVLFVLVIIGVYAVKQFRVIPKIRARLIERTPYEDIVISEQAPGPPNPQLDDSNADARQRIEEGNAAIATLSQDLASRHRKGSEAIVSTFAHVEDELGSTQST